MTHAKTHPSLGLWPFSLVTFVRMDHDKKSPSQPQSACHAPQPQEPPVSEPLDCDEDGHEGDEEGHEGHEGPSDDDPEEGQQHSLQGQTRPPLQQEEGQCSGDPLPDKICNWNGVLFEIIKTYYNNFKKISKSYQKISKSYEENILRY